MELFGFNYGTAFVSAATGASMVWKPGITALGTARQVRARNFLMSPSFITP
jgi:hypothetical protein